VTDELARMRERLATRVVAAHRIGSERVAAALHAVPRHLFLPDQRPEAAYRDDAIVTKRDEAGQPISSSSQPAIMAIMLDQLNLAPGHRVLEIGAGTGYNAALISHIVGPSGQVTSVDIDPELVAAAREHLTGAGFGDVTVVVADGAGGDPEHAPYDRIIASVGVSDLAPAWLAQATPSARIVVPLDVRGTQLSVAFERADPAAQGAPWTSRSLAPCGFMRMRGALAGPERVVPLAPGLSLLLPDGMPAGGMLADGTLADGTPEVAGEAVAALLAGPAARHPTGVRATSAQVFWGWACGWRPTSHGRSGSPRNGRPGGAAGPVTGSPERRGAARAGTPPSGCWTAMAWPSSPPPRLTDPACSLWTRPGSARTRRGWPPTSRRTSRPGARRAGRASRACTSTRIRGPRLTSRSPPAAR